jgi:ribosomal protein S10
MAEMTRSATVNRAEPVPNGPARERGTIRKSVEGARRAASAWARDLIYDRNIDIK